MSSFRFKIQSEKNSFLFGITVCICTHDSFKESKIMAGLGTTKELNQSLIVSFKPNQDLLIMRHYRTALVLHNHQINIDQSDG